MKLFGYQHSISFDKQKLDIKLKTNCTDLNIRSEFNIQQTKEMSIVKILKSNCLVYQHSRSFDKQKLVPIVKLL